MKKDGSYEPVKVTVVSAKQERTTGKPYGYYIYDVRGL